MAVVYLFMLNGSSETNTCHISPEQFCYDHGIRHGMSLTTVIKNSAFGSNEAMLARRRVPGGHFKVRGL